MYSWQDQKKNEPMDVKLKIAIIAALATIVAAALQGPLVNSLYQDRPVIDISLGKSDESLPEKELLRDGTNYYVEFAVRNRGNSDGKILLTVFGNNTKVSFIENGPYLDFAQLNYVVFPDKESKTSKFYLRPNEDAQRIALTLRTEKDTNASYFQELNTIIPLELTFEKLGDTYVLTDKR